MKFTIEVEIDPSMAPTLVRMLKFMEMCGEVGTTRQIVVGIDGDGDARMSFNIPNFPEITTDTVYEELSEEEDNTPYYVDESFYFPEIK